QSKDFCEKRQTILEQKIRYEKIYGVYKKALQIALQDKNDTNNNKENSEPKIVYLQNPKYHHSRGRLL
ncbi:20817_t:CDS:2, partial [Gigaspora rosea]